MPPSVMSRLAVAFLGAAAMVQAAPAAAPVSAGVQVERRAVSDDLLATFEHVQQFAAASYCPVNNNSTGTKLACTSGVCPLVESADTETVLEFENSLLTDVTGYVAVDKTNSLIVVAFRGSNSVRNYLADINFPAIPATDICASCTADAGFYTSWREAREGVLSAVESAITANPDYSIIATGHSLGGAIANFAAAELRLKGHKVKLYTFGAPRIGDSNISDFISDQGDNFRLTHLNDPVPHLPPIALGFVHISPEYYISVENYVEVTANDVTGPLNGSINLHGNTGKLFLDVDAHGWYLGNISSCYPDDLFEFRRKRDVGSVELPGL
ncbi:uncharacterized protein K452DRAFT_87132 [Aplosporella prunicola CBS 121167]|uniref:Fungal lipase-type domain-containing protein n=1 Tax=Aplosporella prunicola CBS 121167 TaxID=1176127 RepID=A0A6A6B5D3_9PEZI|nr:uncharacterized protein K452DRAFT_87132 [Aplosporella prunicola CBS 121167]KAF2138475.1 hypothetical protein K452DRAFT_87132 [Aplosporella prunicola CBS 121167]